MKTKKGLRERKTLAGRRSVTIDYQEINEIINKEELRMRGGITGDTKHYFVSYLRVYFQKKLHHSYAENLIGVAKYIAAKRELYVSTHGGYRLMKISSISDYLHRYSKEAAEELKEEQREKNRYKHKK